MLLIISLIFGTMLRLINLNQSLWLDEAITANAVHKFSYFELITRFAPADFHPPLYYFILKFWTSVFGLSEISLRFPSVIFSLLAALVIYRMALKLFNRQAAVWASLFFYFNPLIIYYSQEARMYSLLVLLFCAALYALIHKNIFLLNLFIFLSLCTFYGSIFFIIPLFVYLWFTRQFRLFFHLLLPVIVFVLIFWSLINVQLTSSRLLLASVPDWSSVLGRFELKNLLLIPLKLTSGRISFYPKIIYFAIASLWALIVFLASWKSILKFKLLSFFLISPIIIASLFALITGGGLQYFRLLFLVPLISLLLAFAVYKQTYIKLAFLSVFALFSLYYLFTPSQHREDWKSLLTTLPANSVIYMIPSFSDPVIYYRPDLQVSNISFLSAMSNNSFNIIPYGEAIHGIDHRSLLSGFAQTKTITKNQVTLEIWDKL